MTAFNEDGSVNLDGVREMVRYNIDVNHIDGLYVGGSTGETFMLSTEEKKSIFKVAYEEAAGKTHLIAQVGSLNLNEAKVRKFTVSKIVENWFYFLNQNKYIDKLIEIIEKDHINDFDKINEEVSKFLNQYFLNNNEFLIEFQSRLLIQAYVARLAGLKMTSSVAYSLCYKNPYSRILINSMIDKSLYFYFLQILNSNNQNDLFKKEIKTNFLQDELKNLISKFEEKWK